VGCVECWLIAVLLKGGAAAPVNCACPTYYFAGNGVSNREFTRHAGAILPVCIASPIALAPGYTERRAHRARVSRGD
jgi:hypothetical protein